VTEHVTLPVHGAHCGGALSVEIQRWEDESPAAGVTLLTEDPTGDRPPDERDAITTFPCPYCQKLNHGRLGGTLVWVVDDEEPNVWQRQDLGGRRAS
jgi:hypothetical protein